ncbi:LolA family protein [Streptomyces boninensis]|uniref:LolA family protein n=1 Tax=Streptomyces boninensis TaxID=2039455 RepID=UPI003B220EF2
MAQIQPEPEQPGGIRRRRAARYVVPLGVAGIAAATIGLVPALAQSEDGPDLDKISAEDLVTKVLESKTQTVSGTVKIKTDLGLPSLPGGMGGGTEGGQALEMLTGDTTLQVAADGPNRQRVTMDRDQGDYTAVHNGKDVWAYDSQKNTAFHGTNYSEKKGGDEHALPKDLQDLTPREFAQEALKKADKTTSVTTDGTANVAGQEAYVLKVAPKQSESTVKDIRIAVDADNGAPLKVTLTSDSGKKAIDAGFTQVDFDKPDAKQFDFTPPKDAKVTEKDLSKQDEGGAGEKDRKDFDRMMKNVEVEGSGWTSIAKIDAGDKFSGSAEGEGQSLLDSFTEKVDGGRVFSTDLINVLIGDDGKIYVGAVTKDALVDAANN